MAELSLRERLQPSLIDRLLDEERLLTVYELTFPHDELRRLDMLERDLVAVLAAVGLSPGLPDGSAVVPGVPAGEFRLRFSAPQGRVGVAQLNALLLKPPGAPAGVPLGQLCTIEARNVLNRMAESPQQRHAVGRRLREHMSRDLTVLLNATSMEPTVDLSALPNVQRSVLNYGMSSPAGKSVTSVALADMAGIIETAIKRFEPRLTRVRVAPDTENDGKHTHELSFRIEAELWGQPAPHQVTLRTRIDTESGHVHVNDTGGG